MILRRLPRYWAIQEAHSRALVQYGRQAGAWQAPSSLLQATRGGGAGCARAGGGGGGARGGGQSQGVQPLAQGAAVQAVPLHGAHQHHLPSRPSASGDEPDVAK